MSYQETTSKLRISDQEGRESEVWDTGSWRMVFSGTMETNEGMKGNEGSYTWTVATPDMARSWMQNERALQEKDLGVTVDVKLNTSQQ